MDILILIVAMIVVGLVIGALAPRIFKGEQPYGASGDYIASVLSTVVIGLLDWFVIPMIISSETIKFIGVAIEPALGALIVLWLMRKAKS
jgi:uncharacterized membrane protein YeaQ/YmgE (transglycosylase-associated protein family)